MDKLEDVIKTHKYWKKNGWGTREISDMTVMELATAIKAHLKSKMPGEKKCTCLTDKEIKQGFRCECGATFYNQLLSTINKIIEGM